MAPRRTIKRNYGELQVFEKSLVYQGALMFLHVDPENITGLIHGVSEMLEKAFIAGKEHKREELEKSHREYMDLLGGHK